MLTPVDIENKEFKKVMRGYDVYEVESFIKDIVSDYEKIYRENSSMKDKIEMLTTSLTNYRNMEETMQNAMIVAQTTSEDIKRTAIDKANNILAEAELKAKNTVTSAEKEIADLKAKYQSLKGEIDTFKSRIKALLLTYDKLLDDFPKNDMPSVKEDIKEEIKPDAKPQIEMPEAPKMSEAEEETKAVPDIYEALKNVHKREQNEKDMMPENPRLDKQNALLDEILSSPKPEDKKSPFKDIREEKTETPKETKGAVHEVVINLGSGQNYDVFKDDTL